MFLPNLLNLTKNVNMGLFGDKIRKLREEKGLVLRKVASELDIDIAILSKIETGQRMANRDLVLRISDYFKIDKKELLVPWISDKILKEVQNEEFAHEAFKVAEEAVVYEKITKIDRQTILDQIISILKEFNKVEQAWIFGSFSRGDENSNSDIDLAIKSSEVLSYFEVAEIQFRIEESIGKKVDIGFLDSFKPYVFENIKDELKLIYERQSQGK